MQKIVSLLAIATLIGITIACQSQPETEPTPESPAESEPVDDDQSTIDEEDENVNDGSGLDEHKAKNECPPKRQHQDMCAQVITYGLTADGVCCEYPTPCDVPENLETFTSRQECQEAAQQ